MPRGVVEDVLSRMTMASVRCLILIWVVSHNYEVYNKLQVAAVFCEHVG